MVLGPCGESGNTLKEGNKEGNKHGNDNEERTVKALFMASPSYITDGRYYTIMAYPILRDSSLYSESERTGCPSGIGQ